jgi:nucleoside-diphosphate-sugar epimerase
MYLQVSGLGVTSDNSHGEHVDVDDLTCYVDIDFSLDQVPQENTHLPQDKLIVEAGTRKENPVRTAIVFPGWIYGVGEGIQKTTLPIRIWIDMFLGAGYAGTWGEGHSIMGNAHVKDVATAVITVLKAMLEGKADEGANGFCKFFLTLLSSSLS